MPKQIVDCPWTQMTGEEVFMDMVDDKEKEEVIDQVIPKLEAMTI